jgi:hypothetical protein
LETAVVNSVTISIPWENHPEKPHADGPAPGPVGEYVEVIDYDPASRMMYAPVDLNNPHLLAEQGLPPSDGDPQFHQQMVYAVAMKTIENFEYALGRLVMWAPRETFNNRIRHDEFVRRLRIHDIIVHEMTHALLDGLHPYFTEQSNYDILAFHEAFADIVALFQHFSYPEVVKHQIAKTRGDMRSKSLLSDLAQQFGRAVGRSEALRSALGKEPEEYKLADVLEPHDRGAILMAAVFDAFISIYDKRTEDLVRLATGGTGVLEEGASLHPDLVNRLAREASKAANHVLTMCIRALDYLPPVDISFGDFLRALITADYDVAPEDTLNYRVAFIAAFRRFGIFPEGVRSLSEENLLWKAPSENLSEMPFVRRLQSLVQGWDLSIDRERLFAQMEKARIETHSIFENSTFKDRRVPGVDIMSHKFEIHSIRPIRRVGPKGQLLADLLVEITQSRPGKFDGDNFPEWNYEWDKEEADFIFRGGCTLIIDMKTTKIRYVIPKEIDDRERYLGRR